MIEITILDLIYLERNMQRYAKVLSYADSMLNRRAINALYWFRKAKILLPPLDSIFRNESNPKEILDYNAIFKTFFSEKHTRAIKFFFKSEDCSQICEIEELLIWIKGVSLVYGSFSQEEYQGSKERISQTSKFFGKFLLTKIRLPTYVSYIDPSLDIPLTDYTQRITPLDRPDAYNHHEKTINNGQREILLIQLLDLNFPGMPIKNKAWSLRIDFEPFYAPGNRK